MFAELRDNVSESIRKTVISDIGLASDGTNSIKGFERNGETYSIDRKHIDHDDGFELENIGFTAFMRRTNHLIAYKEKKLYDKSLEEIDNYLGELDGSLKDYKNACKTLCLTIYDDKPIDDGDNTIEFDPKNIFMLHLGRLIGTVQLFEEDEEEGLIYTYQLCNSYAEYWHTEPAQIWLDALNSVVDMRFMSYEDESDERFEIAESFCIHAMRKLKN